MVPYDAELLLSRYLVGVSHWANDLYKELGSGTVQNQAVP